MTDILLFTAAFFAGCINAVAGGGTLLTFPALLWVGVSPVVANATSTVALVPGSISAFWSYRSEIEDARRNLIWIGAPSVVGGVTGAVLVVQAGDELFAKLVPWLIWSATALFTVQDPLRRWLSRNLSEGERHSPDTNHLVLAMGMQLLVAVYGGFFGAGIGILMLAALGMLGLSNIHAMNGLKTFAAVCINGIAAITFIISREVAWVPVVIMACGAVTGGVFGAGFARRIGQQNVKRMVIGVGVFIGAYMLARPI